jgi:hypothetical protein
MYMMPNRSILFLALLASTALAITPAFAQEQAIDAEPPTSVMAEEVVQSFGGLSGADLAAFFEDADEAERRAFIASLTETERDALIDALSRAGSSSRVLAAVISDIVVADPTIRVCELVDIVKESATQDLLTEIADILVTLIEQDYADIPDDVLAGLMLAGLCCDENLVDRIVLFANTLDEAGADRFARALPRVTDQAPARVASAVETSLALQGGQVAQRVTEVRREEVAAVTTPSDLPSTEVGASERTTQATTSGPDAVFADSSRAPTAGTGITSVGATPRERSPDVSPVR